jgi:hypothetical protein
MRCRLSLIILVVGLALAPLQALADVVVPSADVTTSVIVRASATPPSFLEHRPRVPRLRPPLRLLV